MSVAVIKIEKSKLPALREIAKAMNATMRVVKDEDDIMAKLIEEGLKTEDVSKATVKKHFLKHGIEL